MEDKNFWNKRSEETFMYKGESFYTITPVPLYYKRRRILLEFLTKEIDNIISKKPIKVHDYGCGNGWYLNYLHKLYPDVEFSGFDISESFIKQAKSVLPEKIILSCGNMDGGKDSYNLIYSIAVFAHVSNEEILSIFNNIKEMLTGGGGKFVIFEQTSGSDASIQGSTYIRRRASDYEYIAHEAGFILKDKFTVDFIVHRWFERYVAKKIYCLFKGDSQTERRINANKNMIFRALSNLACVLSFNPIKRKNKNYWGNTFFIFEKYE